MEAHNIGTGGWRSHSWGGGTHWFCWRCTRRLQQPQMPARVMRHSNCRSDPRCCHRYCRLWACSHAQAGCTCCGSSRGPRHQSGTCTCQARWPKQAVGAPKTSYKIEGHGLRVGARGGKRAGLGGGSGTLRAIVWGSRRVTTCWPMSAALVRPQGMIGCCVVRTEAALGPCIAAGSAAGSMHECHPLPAALRLLTVGGAPAGMPA